jgi:predicted transcriptional regulator
MKNRHWLTRTVTIRLDPQTARELTDFAAKRNRTSSWIVRAALRRFMHKVTPSTLAEPPK